MARIFGGVGPHAEQSMRSVAKWVRHGYPVLSEVAFKGEVTHTFGVVDRHPERLIADVQGITVVLDGSIYNRADLGVRAEDPLLIAELYRQFGFPDLLRRLNGDFAIALYDHDKRALWLGRDRVGAKPLYYARAREDFYFCSRPGPLAQLPQIGREVNQRFVAVFAASHYRYIDNVPTESAFARVAQLPAGNWLCASDGKVTTGSYWHLGDAPDLTASEGELAEEYRSLLLDAVDIRLRDCSRPAFTLSGGMDSSSVLACARARSGSVQPAFSTVYSDKTFDESDEIKPMLASCVSKWEPVLVDDPDVFDIVGRMVAVNDEPVATATWLSHFVLCERVASGGFDAVFGGLGGDELNAGEYEYFFFHFADLLRSGQQKTLDSEVEHWIEHHDHPIFRKTKDIAFQQIARLTNQDVPGECRPDPVRMGRYHRALRRDFFDIDKFIPVMETRFSSYLKTRCYQDLTRETTPCCLRAEDRHTQAFGLDNHVPFLDHRLIEFMFRVSGSMKIRNGTTKILLREAMKGILPEETRTRVKKTGWNAPAHLWFSGGGRAQLLDLIHSREFIERGIYDVDEVLRLLDEHEEIVRSGVPRENHMMFFWQLVNVELWLRSLRLD